MANLDDISDDEILAKLLNRGFTGLSAGFIIDALRGPDGPAQDDARAVLAGLFD